MITRPKVPSAAAVEAHFAHSAERQRSGRRLIWGILIGFVLLLMLTPLVLYLGWQARGRAILRQQLATIKASGDPLSTTEMAAWQAVPAGTPDITAIWRAAIKPFDAAAFTATGAALPLVGNGPALPPLDQPLPAADEQAIRDYLLLHQDAIAAVYAAAREQGEVRFTRDFRHGIAMLLPEVQQVRNAVRVLDLEFELLARESNMVAAIENLETRVTAGETLRHEPILVSMLVRVAVQWLNMEDMLRLAETGKLNDQQLVQLQELVRTLDIHAQMPTAVVGERAGCYHAFHQAIGFAGPETDGTGNVVRDTSYDVSDVNRPEDCAKALEMLTEMCQAAEQPPHQMLDALAGFDERIQDLRGGDLSLNRLRFMLTTMLMPAMQNSAVASARGEALCDITDAALAVRRYHQQHGKAPITFEELVPAFLPQVPTDSFDGQPLRWKDIAPNIVIYSVGKDRRDDGGQSDANNQQPDIAVEVKLLQ